MQDDLPESGAGRPDPEEFGRGLAAGAGGLGVNLIVRDVGRAAAFQSRVFGARVSYRDGDFAILGLGGSVWMLHHDRTYRAHPFRGVFDPAELRGAGVELRLYGADPDRAAELAGAAGGTVLDPPADKPHGLREAFIADPEGYVWVPSVPKGAQGE